MAHIPELANSLGMQNFNIHQGIFNFWNRSGTKQGKNLSAKYFLPVSLFDEVDHENDILVVIQCVDWLYFT